MVPALVIAYRNNSSMLLRRLVSFGEFALNFAGDGRVLEEFSGVAAAALRDGA